MNDIAPRTRPTVLVRTRPVSYGNYGGILQAYALQQVLQQLGFDAVTDESTGAGDTRVALNSRLKTSVRSLLTRADIPRVTRASWVAESIKKHRDASLHDFVARNIATVRLYADDGSVRSEVCDGVDAFVSGSDQVWRADYGRVLSYMFDMLDAGDARPRVAYAASFGRGDLEEYDASLEAQASTLLKRFTAISVREDTGVDLCRRLGVDAVHRIDPTMLLDSEHYRRLAPSNTESRAPGAAVSYVLDRSPDVVAQIQAATSLRGLPGHALLPKDPPTRREYFRNPGAFARPTVTEWLATISTAGLVVTDSFHGTVFSILYNVPFLSIANSARGAARFESVLKMLGLEHRLVTPGTDIRPEHVDEGIAWQEVNARIDAQRALGRSFIADSLVSLSQRHDDR